MRQKAVHCLVTVDENNCSSCYYFVLDMMSLITLFLLDTWF